jgi:hypothetical protein
MLLIEVEVDADGFEVLDGAQEIVRERSRRSMAQAITTSNFLRLAPLSMASGPGRWSIALAPADASILVDPDNLPAAASATSLSSLIWFSTVCASVERGISVFRPPMSELGSYQSPRSKRRSARTVSAIEACSRLRRSRIFISATR